MDWNSKNAVVEKYSSLKAYNSQFESEEESIIDHDSMFGHVHQNIHSDKNYSKPKSVKTLSATEHNAKVLKNLFDKDLNVIGENDVEDSDDQSSEIIKKEIKKGPQPGIMISGQHEKLVGKIKEESNILNIEKKDEKNVEIDKQKVKEKEEVKKKKADKQEEEYDYDKEFYNKLVELEKAGDYRALIEYCIDVRCKTALTEQNDKTLDALRKFDAELLKDEKKYNRYIEELGNLGAKYDYIKGQEMEALEKQIKEGHVPGTESLKQDPKAAGLYASQKITVYGSEASIKKRNIDEIMMDFAVVNNAYVKYHRSGDKKCQELSKQDNKPVAEVLRIKKKGERSCKPNELRAYGYSIDLDKTNTVKVSIAPWRQMANMLAREGENAPSEAELDGIISENQESFQKVKSIKKIIEPASQQLKLVLERYRADLESLKSDHNISKILDYLKIYTEDPYKNDLGTLSTGFSVMLANARRYRVSHDGWFRKRWGASNRVLKLVKNLEAFCGYYDEKYKEIAGRDTFVNNVIVNNSVDDFNMSNIEDIQLYEKQLKERRDELRKLNENEINTNTINIREEQEPVNINENTKKTATKKKPARTYNVDKDSYSILYALRDDALSARSSGNNSPQYDAFIQCFNDLQLTAFDIYHKNGDKGALLKLYAKQVNDLKLAAKAYIDYKYSYRTEDQTKEPGKDKLNKRDREKLDIAKRVIRHSFSAKVQKPAMKKMITLADDVTENINIRINKVEDVIINDAQDEVSHEEMTMTYEQNILGNRISREKFVENGGAVKHRYVTETEANKIVADTHGFLAAIKVKGKKGIVEIVPSLPEYTTYYNGKKSEKRIPLRKTMKTLFKTIAHILVDNKGHIRKDIDEYNGKSVATWLDDLMLLSSDDYEQMEEIQPFINDIFKPAMVKMLEKDYKAKAVKNHKARARIEADEVCKNYIELIKGFGKYQFRIFTSAQNFESFVTQNIAIKTMKANDIMNHKLFKTITIDGRNLTRKEVETALKEFKDESDNNVSEFAQIRDIDLDSVQMPGFGSGDENAHLMTGIMNEFVDDKDPHVRIEHNYKDFAKKNPEKALDIMIGNLDNIIESGYDGENAAQNKDIIRNLDKKRKSKPLTKQDVNTIVDIYMHCSKYEWHRAPNLAISGNVLYTEETYASLPHQLQKAPITNNVATGIYITDKPMGRDEENGMIKHPSFSSYYDHDDAFAHCKDRNSVIRAKLKDIVYRVAKVSM